MDKKLVTIAIVAILVIAGIGCIVYYLSADDGDSDESAYVEGRLMIFGNATNDDYLDNADLKFIQSIVDGDTQWDRDANPYADANNDGRINSADIDFVKRLINREPMKIWYMDGMHGPMEIKYPLKTIAIVGNQQMVRAQALDILDKVEGISGTSLKFDDVLNKTISQKPRISDSPFKLDLAMYSEVSQNVPGGIDAVYCSEATPEDDTVFVQNGVTLVHLEGITVEGEMQTYLTLGYLTQAEERSHQLIDFMDHVFRQIDEKVLPISYEDRPTVTYCGGPTTSTIGGIIRSNEQTGNDRVYMAGAVNKITIEDIGAPFKTIKQGDVWQLSEKFQADYFLASLTGIGYNTSIQFLAKLWEDRYTSGNFNMTKMTAYPDFIFIAHDVSSVVYIAYLAEYLNPGFFEEGFGDKVHQEWGDKFFRDLKGFDASQINVLVTYDDVKPYFKN